MITVRIKDGCRRPYLSTDRNHFRADINRPLVEHLRQDSKQSNNPTSGFGEDVTVLSKGQLTILKMAADGHNC